jgi:UTP:GlnB (protein PII) uridylyltransferase
MKILSIIILLIMPAIASAQNYRGMNEQDMQKMMQQMQEMETCMQNIDQTKLKALEQRSNQFEAEMKSLCADGRRDEAQTKAIAFGREFSTDPTIQAMRKCGELMQGVMPVMPFMDEDEDYSSRHVCD